MLVAQRMRRPRVRLGAAAAIAVAAGAATWVIAVRPSDQTTAPSRAAAPAAPVQTPTQARAARIVSAAALQAFAKSQPAPVFWAGTKSGTSFELTAAGNGRVYVRYLRPGIAAGSPRPDFLTVGTYAQSDALAHVRAAGRQQSAVTITLSGGGLAVYSRSRPTNIFLAYPAANTQIEVYDPSAREARTLVQTGAIRPIADPIAAAAPRALTLPALRSFAASQRSAVYWAGSRPRAVYEVTDTSDGRVYIRYLASTAQIGSPQPAFLTIGTYPDRQAFVHVRAVARQPGAVSIPQTNGVLAVYVASHPTSVYLARPGAREQIEVYSPSATEARRLVEQDQVRPVR